MSAKTSGADASNGGAARSREHNQGNQGRGCTPEQKAAVLRIRRCRATAFYEILAVEASCSDAEIKKAYRKQSLLTHPDKNGHEHADEAFKMVARAFSVLGDKEKRDKFDRFGTDPDSRFDSARQQQQQQQNPFAGFANRQRATGGGGGGFGGGFDEEISPEEMFRRFFGGGGFGGPFGGGFDTGPQFVFNMGGGPGIRVHQFGGGRPRRRPRDGADPQQQQQQAEASILSTVIGLLPVIFLFIIPLITSLFSGPTAPAVPDVVFDMPLGAHSHRQVHETGLNFFVREEDWARIRENKNKVSQLHQQAYVTFVNRLKRECEQESHQQQRLHEAAQGWFYVDQDMLDRARSHPKPSCSRLERLLRGNGKPDGQQQGKTKAS